MRKNKRTIRAAAIAAALVIAALFSRGTAEAETADELRAKISENNRKIDELQKQIGQYSSLLDSTSKQAQTLKSALSNLELTQKKLETSLALTSTQISKTRLTLAELDKDIKDTEQKIGKNTEAISESVRSMNVAESESVLEDLLVNKSISDAWDYVNSLRTIESRISIELTNLQDAHKNLSEKRDQVTGEKKKLESYSKQLADQSLAVKSSKETKNKLLEDTKNKEANYKLILAQKVAEEEKYEKELYEYESKLKITIDPSAIPDAKHSVLSWPLDKVSLTQLFGKTSSSKRLYTSGTHNGIDFRASIGTQVKAALSGTVTETEALKSKSGCQYGKFVLIKHANGLSTIYGHLSVVSVKPGDVVITGDTIGYSGDTGYATGPHLHLGLYATQGIRIVDSSTLGSTRCAGIKTVAAPPSAYLDPMAYLPNL